MQILIVSVSYQNIIIGLCEYLTDGGRGKIVSGMQHRLNMELDIQSLFGLNVNSCTHWPRLHPPPISPHLGSYTRALLVSQDKRHLFVTPWIERLRNPLIVRLWSVDIYSTVHPEISLRGVGGRLL